MNPPSGRRAGIVGSPVATSLSPVLHRAAYDGLGLRDWDYSRRDVQAADLERWVASLGPEWVGLSVTMPLKEAALALADSAGSQAELTGGANTLVRHNGGWHAANTDVAGLLEALREGGVRQPRHAVIVGSGATARSALLALNELGAGEVRFAVRRHVREETLELARQLGMGVQVLGYSPVSAAWSAPDVVISTVPSGATPPVDDATGLSRSVVLDVVYAGWPTPWARALQDQGIPVMGGGTMLLHQAVAQVRLMTGLEPPVDLMRLALTEAMRSKTPG